MRIAQVAPIIERVPPKTYGGTERVVSTLTEELVRRGHEVTLFASGDSMTSARLVSVTPRSLREIKWKDLYGLNMRILMHIGLPYQQQDAFDVIHDHNAYMSLPIAEVSHTPTLMTMHGPFTIENRQIFEQYQRPFIATISQSQTRFAPQIRHVGTVYNGLNTEQFPFSAEHDGYLLFVGRISVEKGVHIAIEVAQYLNIPLIIAAKLDAVDRLYFREYVEPALSADIRWIGEVDEYERNKLYSRAMAFLHPVTWREPFGLTLIEAMACGCPIIAFNKGSIPEIVVHEKTGFVVADIEEMINAVHNVASINRAACREHVLQHFSVTQLADGYEVLYQQIIEQTPQP